MHRRSVWRFIVGYSADIVAFISRLVYRSYKRVVGVLYRLSRLGIERMLSPCYALIWRLYAVVWRVYGVLWRVYCGLCDHGLRSRPTG